MFEQMFKNMDNILHKNAGGSREFDSLEKTFIMLFFKGFKDLKNA